MIPLEELIAELPGPLELTELPDPSNHEGRGWPTFTLPRIPRLRLRRPKVRLPRLRVPAELLEDGALLSGLAAIAAGAGWIYPPAAAIVGGAFLVWLGLRAASRAESEPQLREPTQVVEQYVFGDVEED